MQQLPEIFSRVFVRLRGYGILSLFFVRVEVFVRRFAGGIIPE